jgi:hypothetical protein
VQKTPTSTSGFDANVSLSGISCPSTSSCMAVGSTRHRTRAQRWNGTKWSRVRVPEPPHTTSAALTAVDCPSTRSCIAVGYFTTHRIIIGKRIPYAGMAERWNGTKWTVKRIPGANQLTSLSCPSGHNCIAVGAPTVIRLAGTHWSEQPSSPGSLLSVSCPSSRACSAVGNGHDVERWNGTLWSRQATPTL